MVFISRSSQSFDPIGMIMPMSILAIAFSSQLLPITIDVLFIKKGTRHGAIAGIICGMLLVLMFSPIPAIISGTNSELVSFFARLKKIADIGFYGVIINTTVFLLVSFFQKKKFSH